MPSKRKAAAPADETCIYDAIRRKCTSRAGSVDTDRALAELAGRQHGVIARRQVLALGISGRAVSVRVARRRLHRVHQGVYAVGHPLLDARGRCMASVLACGSGAVLSHRSAAWLWGMVPSLGVKMEVTRPRSFRKREGVNAHCVPLRLDEMATLDGIPVTGVSRTLLDLAALLPRARFEQAWNEAEVLGLEDRLSVPALLDRYPRRSGAASLRHWLAEDVAARGVTRLALEERFRELLASTELPLPLCNADVSVAGRFFEVDCLWPDRRLIVELDGRAVHGTRRAFERDRERDRLLMTEGWRVVRITWKQLDGDAPRVLADLRRLLSAE